jgi:transposase InsO family protein
LQGTSEKIYFRRFVRQQTLRSALVADITYIHLRAEFVYLAVILDGFSRKVVGWALGVRSE